MNDTEWWSAICDMGDRSLRAAARQASLLRVSQCHADSFTDNMSVRTSTELQPKCNWKMNAWHRLPWHWNAFLVLNFTLKLLLGSLCWHQPGWLRAKFDCWRLHHSEMTRWDYSKLISSQIYIPSLSRGGRRRWWKSVCCRFCDSYMSFQW